MTPRSPQRPCAVCGRLIAVVGGRIWRHDPPERSVPLLSCPGSHKAPRGAGIAGQLEIEVDIPVDVSPPPVMQLALGGDD